MNKGIGIIQKLLQKHKFRTEGSVNFHEVDSFQVVHNLQYLYWTEVSRVQYCRHIGIGVVPASANQPDFSVLLVHSDIDYFHPARFGDQYFVYTRTKKLGNTSLEFEHIVTLADSTPVAINHSVEVYVDMHKNSISIPADIRSKIIAFEKENLNN